MTTSSLSGASAPPKTRKKPATRIPDDFSVTPDMVAWATEHCPGIDGRRETEKFRDHWAAAAGPTSVKKDWRAAWRNWMRGAQDRGPHRPSNVLAIRSPNGHQAPQPSVETRRVTAAAEIAARYAAQGD